MFMLSAIALTHAASTWRDFGMLTRFARTIVDVVDRIVVDHMMRIFARLLGRVFFETYTRRIIPPSRRMNVFVSFCVGSFVAIVRELMGAHTFPFFRVLCKAQRTLRKPLCE